MRSADASGVGTHGVGGGNGGKKHASDSGKTAFWTIANLRAQISPVTAAIALTALLAATVFVLVDTARTLDEARGRLQLVGRAMAAELSVAEPAGLEAALRTSSLRFSPYLHATLRDVDGRLIATSYDAGQQARTPRPLLEPALIRQETGAGALGMLSLELDEAGAFAGAWQRALGAFALALFFIVITYRRPQPKDDLATANPFQSLLAALPLGVACWNKAGALVASNEQYRNRLDLDQSAMRTGTSYHTAIKGLIQGGYMRLVNENDSNRLLELHREDGSCLVIDERPLQTGGFITLVSDATERKRTDVLLHAIREEQRLLARKYHEEKLKAEAASRSKTNFLAHLSHDIRTPLNHIIGFAELMRHETYGPLGDERYIDYVQTIKSSGEKLLNSFATILDFAELEGGHKTLRSEPVHVDELLKDMVQRFSAQSSRAGLTIALGAPTDAVVMADRFCLQRMLGNIMENAVRFTANGGRVSLAAFAADDGVVIEVSDTGIGMSEQRLESLSQPFALGSAAFTRDGDGPGLGIAIARAIAELSGGRLAIDSSPALGTTVAISLPLNSAESANQQAAE